MQLQWLKLVNNTAYNLWTVSDFGREKERQKEMGKKGWREKEGKSEIVGMYVLSYST